ncbi:MAG: hypothetical protein ACI3VB_08105 [Oscillospiraceae bacterium]
MSLPSRPAGKAGGRLSVRELVTLSLIAAIMIALKEAMSGLPNIEPVSLILIACALVYGVKSLYVAIVFVLVEILIYGLGLWTITYFYIWPMLTVVTLLLRNMKGRLLWALVSGLYGLFFGALCSVPYLFIGGVKMAFSYWASGIPFDILHCAGNFALALVLLDPCVRILRRSVPDE